MRSVEKDFLLRGHDPQLRSGGIPRTQNLRTFIESLECVTHCETGVHVIFSQFFACFNISPPSGFSSNISSPENFAGQDVLSEEARLPCF